METMKKHLSADLKSDSPSCCDSFVAWDFCTLPRNQGSLGLPNISTQGAVLVSKWVVWAVKGNAPWKLLFQHQIHQALHIQVIKGHFSTET
jgi:hypothetical protein